MALIRDRAGRRSRDQKKLMRRKAIVNTGNAYNPYRGFFRRTKVDGGYVEDQSHIQYLHSSEYRRFLKRDTSRKNRRTMVPNVKGNYYRKVREFWWDLF